MCIVKINNYDLPIREYQGRRVVTLKDIDLCHERPEGTARKRFNDNKKHFIEGEDFFVISEPSEIRTLGLERPQGGVPEKVILITQQGYLMIVKSFTDDLAWEVQRMLVNSYFAMTNRMGIINDKMNHFIDNISYSQWCTELQDPLITIQMQLNLTSTRAALVRVYETFEALYGFTVEDVRCEYVKVNTTKQANPEIWAKEIFKMPMLRFIYSLRNLRREVNTIILEMAAQCNSELPYKPKTRCSKSPLLSD